MKFKIDVDGNHGLLSKIIYDRNILYWGKLWKELLKSISTNLALSTAFRTEADSQSDIVHENSKK